MSTLWRALAAVAALAAALAAAPAAAQRPPTAAPLSTPAWVQWAAAGRDASASHDGQRWFVGTDGRARRWLAARGAWAVHGTRSDFVRIDAGPEGAAAITTSGELFVTSAAEGDDWRALGVRAADVGIGAGRLWLADARGADGSLAVLHAPFDASGRTPTWNRLERRFVRIDVGPDGRPWALDAEGRLFVLPPGAGTQWLAQNSAPAAADVGVGGNGAVLVVARVVEVAATAATTAAAAAADATQGGGAVYQRVPGAATWRLLPGRLSAVSVDPEGRAFGVNALAWVLASVAAAEGEPVVAVGPPPPPTTTPPTPPRASDPEGDPSGRGTTTLAALAGADLPLPPGIAQARVVGLSGDVARGTASGRLRLNGLNASVVRYTPAGASQPVLAIGHESMSLADYVPELVGTGVQALRLSQPVFFFVAPGQTARVPTAADAAVLNRVFTRQDLAEAAPAAGISLLASVDVRQVGPFSAVTSTLGLGTSTVAVSSENLSPALFTSVSSRADKPTATRTTVAAFNARYGEALLRNLALRAPARELDGRALGPLALKQPVWRLSAALSDTGVQLLIALDARLELKLRAPASQAAIETLAMNDARLTIEPLTRSVQVAGTLTRDEAATVASLRGLQLQTASVQGQLVIGAGAGLNAPLPLEALQLVVDAKGQVPSLRLSASSQTAAVNTGAPVALDLQLALALDEAKTALVPSATVRSDLTLADLSGIDSPAARGVRLQEVQWTPGTLSGKASLYGLTVRVVRHQEGTAAPVVGLHHQELDLGSYVPRLHQTKSLGTLGLANAVVYVNPESAPAQRFASRSEMPAALAALLDRQAMPDEQIFPLTLAPGVTVIGQIDTAGSASAGLTNQALAAWGLADQRYVVKGSFKASALRNPSFGAATQRASSGVREVRSVSARDVACAATAVAEALPTEGLDVSFQVPNFAPPYAGRNLQFSNTRMAIKEIDGELEPALVSAVRIQLPRQVQGGISELGLAAKLQARGDLSVLCRGITPATNGELTIAGSTAFNLAQVANVAFKALERLTVEEAPADAAAGAAAPGATAGSGATGAAGTAGAGSAGSLGAPLLARADRLARLLAGAPRNPDMGWKRAFGLPFLTVNQLALSGTVGQRDGKRSLSATLWTDSVLGSERVDALGRLSFEAANAQADFALSDWLLKVPSPVKLTGLPGMAALNQRLPALELSDLTVSQLSLAPTEMTGDLGLPSRNMQGRALFRLGAESTDDAPAFELFAGVNRFALNWLLKPNAQLPGAAGQLTLGSSFFALRGAATVEQQRVGDLPAGVKPLLTTAAGPLLTDDATFALVRGLSLAGRVTPGEIPNDAALAPIQSLFAALGVTAPVPLFGGVEAAAAGSASTEPKGSFLETLIASVNVPGLPADGSGGAVAVRNLRLSLSSRDGRRITGAGQAALTLPQALRGVLGQAAPNNAALQFAYQRSAAGDSLAQWSAATDIAWPSALSLPDLNLGQLNIEVETRQAGSQPVSSSFQVSAVGSYRGVAVKARLRNEQLTQAGSGASAAVGTAASGHVLVELTAVEPEGRLNLATLLNPLAVLPAGYDSNAGPAALFRGLTASRLLLAREARTGRITLAAEDVTGQLRDQPFSGQLAVVGITNQPVLFVRSEAPISAGALFGPLVQTSPLADVALPQGLVILSPSKANFRLSEIHPAIADKVFAGLYDAPAAAEVLANEGLTVLARLSLPQGLPAAMTELVPWLPTSGQMLLGAGMEGGGASGTRTLALFASATGMGLRIPEFAQSVVKSAGGNVLFTARSVGTGTAAVTEASLQTDATVVVPRFTTAGTREMNTQISLNTRRQGNGDGDLLLRVQTDLSLPGWLSLPQLTASNLGLELATSRRGATSTNSVVLSSDVTVATVKAKARLGLNTNGSGFDGGLVELIAADEDGRFDLATLLAPLNLPASYGALTPNLTLAPWQYLRSFTTSGVLLAKAANTDTLEIAARDVRGQLNNQAFRGQLAAVVRPSGPVLFVRSDNPITVGNVFPSQVRLGPFGALGLPEGLVILSPQNGDVNLSTLHPRVYEAVFASFFDSPASAIVPAKNGLAVLAKLNLGTALPAPLNLVSNWLPASGKLIVGGGIEDAASAAPKLAFYANVQGLTLRVPAPLDNFVQTTGGNLVFFFKTKGAAGAGVEVGLQTAVKLKAPRLDTLQQQNVDATLALTASSEAGSPGELTIGANVTGTWSQPLGFGGFALTDTTVELGTSATGFVVNINSEKAEFTTSSGEKKSMYLDLFSTWTPAGVPSKLSVQMGKSPTMAGDLVLSPGMYAEVVNSVLQLGMKGGSALAAQVRTRLQQAMNSQAAAGAPALPTQATLDLFDGFASRLNTAGTTAMSLMRHTPLGLVAVKNPTVFFATPGNEPPRRQGVEQPPFGLGLRVSGQLLFDPGFSDGKLALEVASGVARIDLLNGFSVSGTVTAPSPFGGNTLALSGSQPLLQTTPSALRMSGSLTVPNAGLLPGNRSAVASGHFDFVRPPLLPTATDINVTGSLSLAGLASRSGTFNLRGTTLTVFSEPDGCIDVPLKLEGTLTLPNVLPSQVVGLVKPGSVATAVLNCTPGWLRDTVGPAVDAVLNVTGAAGAVAGQGAAVVLQGVSGVPVVGGPAAAAAGAAFNAAINPSRTATQAADFAISTAVLMVTNPGAAVSASLQQLGNAFGAAKQELNRAVDAMADIGCKVFGWMPGDHPCRRRERAARARRDAAAAAAAEAERRYVEAYFLSRYLAAEAPFAASEQKRWEAQRTRNTETTQQQIATQAEVNRVTELPSAARCSHAQIWDASVRACVTPGVGLIAYTAVQPSATNPTRCLVRAATSNGAALTVATCSTADAMYWQLTNDFQIRAVAPRVPIPALDANALCVQRPQDAAQDGNLTLGPCRTGTGTAATLNPRTTGWSFTATGQFTLPGNSRCLLPANTTNGAPAAWRLCSAVPATAGSLQWTPVVPTDRVGLAGLPRTARLKVGASDLCLATDGAYQSALILRACAAADLDQDFSFGFESANHTTIQSRNRLSCISIGSYKQTAADERLPQTEACFATEAQQFQPQRNADGSFAFINRATLKCLAADVSGPTGTPQPDSELVEADCVAGNAAQSFTPIDIPNLTGRSYALWLRKRALLVQAESVASFHQSNANYYPFEVRNGGRCLSNPSSGSANFSEVQNGCHGVMLVPGRVGGTNHVSLAFHQLANEGRPAGIEQSLLPKWKDALVLKARAPLATPPVVVFERTTVENTAWDLQATFKLVPALSGDGNAYSFESLALPGSYLARASNGMTLVSGSTPGQRAEASFTLVRRDSRGN